MNEKDEGARCWWGGLCWLQVETSCLRSVGFMGAARLRGLQDADSLCNKKVLKHKWHISEGLKELKSPFWHKGIGWLPSKTNKFSFWSTEKNFLLNWKHNCRTGHVQHTGKPFPRVDGFVMRKCLNYVKETCSSDLQDRWRGKKDVNGKKPLSLLAAQFSGTNSGTVVLHHEGKCGSLFIPVDQ